MAHPVMIEVTKQGNNYVFTPRSGLWRGGRFVFNKNALQMSEHDWHIIEFWLHPTKNEGLRFATPQSSAMWVIRPRPAHTCPDQSDVNAGHIDYSVMGPLAPNDPPSNGGRMLPAYNSNLISEQWAFTLNFVDQSGNIVPWDPVGDNQNGGHPLVKSNLAAYIGIAIGAGVVSAVAATTLTLMALRLI